jgi:FixJ family two-component response regulator
MPRSHELHEVPTVFVVDPDPSTGQTTRELLNSAEVGCELYQSGARVSRCLPR